MQHILLVRHNWNSKETMSARLPQEPTQLNVQYRDMAGNRYLSESKIPKKGRLSNTVPSNKTIMG